MFLTIWCWPPLKTWLTCSCRKPNILNQLAKVWNRKSNTVWSKSAKTYWVLIQTFFFCRRREDNRTWKTFIWNFQLCSTLWNFGRNRNCFFRKRKKKVSKLLNFGQTDEPTTGRVFMILNFLRNKTKGPFVEIKESSK